MTTLSHSLQKIQEILFYLSETPRLDAEVLLAHVLGKSRAFVIAHPEFELTPIQDESIQAAVSHLVNGEALPYVLGHQEFFGLDFVISPQTLIPRPETELLVETAIQWLKVDSDLRFAADIGTGSGIIAISLAKAIADLHIVATDISLPALKIAQNNAFRHGVDQRVFFVQTDLLSGLNRKFNLICANLPYIPTSTLQSLPIYGREPLLALDGGEDGLTIIRALLKNVSPYLNPGSLLLLEIEANHSKQSYQLAQEFLPQAKITLEVDLAGRDRLLAINL